VTLELRRLRYFVAVVDELHFGRAAAALHVSPSTLSQQLTALEREVHATLLDRGPRGVTLTPAGDVLLVHARSLLAAADRAASDVAAAHSVAAVAVPEVTVRLATGVDLVLRAALQELPAAAGLRVNLNPTHATDAEQAVTDGRADAAIIWLRSPGSTLSGRVLTAVEAQIALPAGHPLGAADAVDIDALADETVVLFPRHLAPSVWDRLLSEVLPRGTQRSDQVLNEPTLPDVQLARYRVVANGGGVAPVLPAELNAPPPGVEVRSTRPPMSLPIEVVWREPAAEPVKRLVTTLAKLTRNRPAKGAAPKG
jgi:DNA-binding transcriptional LysR family regulator